MTTDHYLDPRMARRCDLIKALSMCTPAASAEMSADWLKYWCEAMTTTVNALMHYQQGDQPIRIDGYVRKDEVADALMDFARQQPSNDPWLDFICDFAATIRDFPHLEAHQYRFHADIAHRIDTAWRGGTNLVDIK